MVSAYSYKKDKPNDSINIALSKFNHGFYNKFIEPIDKQPIEDASGFFLSINEDLLSQDFKEYIEKLSLLLFNDVFIGKELIKAIDEMADIPEKYFNTIDGTSEEYRHYRLLKRLFYSLYNEAIMSFRHKTLAYYLTSDILNKRIETLSFIQSYVYFILECKFNADYLHYMVRTKPEMIQIELASLID